MIGDLQKVVKEIGCMIPNGRNNYVVYTASFGSYDIIRDPLRVNPKVDYICFTDNKEFSSKVWQCIYLDVKSFDSRLLARSIKHLPHLLFPKYQYSMWIDAKCQIIGNSDNIFKASLEPNSKFSLFRHHIRSRVYQEVFACIKIGHDSFLKIIKQYVKYRLSGFRDDSDLIESRVLVRRHLDQEVVEFQEAWFNEVCSSSIRDQLSFNYIAWLKGFNYDLISNIGFSDFFMQHEHMVYGVYDKSGALKIPWQRRFYNIIKRFL